MIKYLLRIGGFYRDKRLAELAETGLRDRNPERILRSCEHLHTEILTYGPIWDMVALPSTGIKILYCEKKEVVRIGLELDKILASMKEEECPDCKFKSPRPGGWKWTHEWHRDREKPKKNENYNGKFLHIIGAIDKTTTCSASVTPNVIDGVGKIEGFFNHQRSKSGCCKYNSSFTET